MRSAVYAALYALGPGAFGIRNAAILSSGACLGAERLGPPQSRPSGFVGKGGAARPRRLRASALSRCACSQRAAPRFGAVTLGLGAWPDRFRSSFLRSDWAHRGAASLRLGETPPPPCGGWAFLLAPLHPPLCAYRRASAQDKAANRPLKNSICPLPIQPAQDRQPHGTRPGPLSAARFPA